MQEKELIFANPTQSFNVAEFAERWVVIPPSDAKYSIKIDVEDSVPGINKGNLKQKRDYEHRVAEALASVLNERIMISSLSEPDRLLYGKIY